MGSKKTFTLIEILIVVLVIGVLASALIPKLQGAQARTRDAVRQVSLHDIYNAIETYAIDNNWLYPVVELAAQQVTFESRMPFYSSINILGKAYNFPVESFFKATKVFASAGDGEPQYISWSVEWIKWLLASYVSYVPMDPSAGLQANDHWYCNKGGKYFAYYSENNSGSFAVTAIMETKKWNTMNCIWVIDTYRNWDFIVIGKNLYDMLHPENPEGWYDGQWSASEWCKNHITQDDVNALNDIILEFSGTAQTKTGLCETLIFSLTDRTFGMSIPSSPNAGAKQTIDFRFNKLVWLEKLDLSAGTIQTLFLPFTLYSLKTIRLDGNKHLKNLVLNQSFPNLEEFSLQDSLLWSLDLPLSAPKLKRLYIYNTSLNQVFNTPKELPSLEELIITKTQLQTITLPDMPNLKKLILTGNQLTDIVLPSTMPKLTELDLRGNNFKRPLAPSTCALLRDRWWLNAAHIDNSSKICN